MRRTAPEHTHREKRNNLVEFSVVPEAIMFVVVYVKGGYFMPARFRILKVAILTIYETETYTNIS
jgi:hypothetical protein